MRQYVLIMPATVRRSFVARLYSGLGDFLLDEEMEEQLVAGS